MTFGTLKSLCTAAALAAMAVPAAAQGERSNEGGTRAFPNGARGAEGEVGTVRGNTGAPGGTVGGTVGGAINRGVNGAAGVVREGANAADRIVREGANAAEDITTPDRPVAGAANGDGRMNQGRLGDAALARWLIADNEGEVRLGEIASQKSQNDDVKQFAQEMVNDHGKMVQQLQQLANRDAAGRGNRPGAVDENGAAPAAGRRTANFPPNAAGRETTDDPTRTARNAADLDADRNPAVNDGLVRDVERPGMGRQGGNNPAVALHVQIKQNLTQMLAKDLQSKNGAEFDKCYIGGQIMAHQAELATLQTAQQFASADVKPMLNDAAQEVQKHLDQAKQIMEQLEGQSRNNR